MAQGLLRARVKGESGPPSWTLPGLTRGRAGQPPRPSSRTRWRVWRAALAEQAVAAMRTERNRITPQPLAPDRHSALAERSKPSVGVLRQLGRARLPAPNGALKRGRPGRRGCHAQPGDAAPPAAAPVAKWRRRTAAANQTTAARRITGDASDAKSFLACSGFSLSTLPALSVPMSSAGMASQRASLAETQGLMNGCNA